jgi:hypothetical protein
MRNLVLLYLEQQTAIADLQEARGLTAIPAGVPEGPLDRLNLGPGSQRAQGEIVPFVKGRRMVRLSRRLRRVWRTLVVDRNGLVDLFHQKLTNQEDAAERVPEEHLNLFRYGKCWRGENPAAYSSAL